MNKNSFKIDRTAFLVISLKERDEDEKNHWQAKTPRQRLEALEITRQIIYGYDPVTTRFQRFFEIAEQT